MAVLLRRLRTPTARPVTSRPRRLRRRRTRTPRSRLRRPSPTPATRRARARRPTARPSRPRARTRTAPRPTPWPPAAPRRSPASSPEGWASRFLARLIDGILIGVVSVILIVLDQPRRSRGIIGGIIYLGYYVYMESSRGRTLGKQILKLRVHGAAGGNPTMEEAFKRNAWAALGDRERDAVIGIITGLGRADRRHRHRRHDQLRPAQARLARQVRQHQRHQGGLSSLIDPDDLAARLTSELDERLAEADAQLAARYPGERAGRQPVHTAYVPADVFTADTAHGTGAGRRRRCSTSTPTSSRRWSPTPTSSGGSRPSWPTSRSRTCGSTSRTATSDGERDDDDEDEHVRTAAHALAEAQQDETAPPFAGIRIKSFEAPTRARGVRTLTRFLAALHRVARLAGRVRGDAAEGDEHRAGGGVRARRVLDRGRARPGGRVGAVRGAGRDPAVGARPRRHRAGRPDGARGGRPADRPALRHLRLLGVLRDRRGPAVARAPGRRPRQARHAGRRRGHRGAALRRLHQRAPRRRRRRRAPGLGEPPPARHPFAGARVLPGLGPAPGPPADAVRRDVRASSAAAWPARSSGCARTRSSGRKARSPTSPPPPGRWPTSCSAASTAARSTRPRCATGRGLDDADLRRLARR